MNFDQNRFHSILATRQSYLINHTPLVFVNETFDFLISLTTYSYGIHIYLRPLSFENCIFRESVCIGPKEIAGNISFLNCTFESDIECFSDNSNFDSCIFENLHLTIDRFIKDFKISGLVVNGNLQIVSTHDHSWLHLEKILNSNGDSVNELSILGKFDHLFLNNIDTKFFEISAIVKKHSVFFEEVKVTKLIILNCDFEKEVKFNKCIVSEFEFKNNLVILSTSMMNCNIGEISVPLNKVKSFQLHIAKVKKLHLTGTTSADSIIMINQSFIDDLYFIDVNNLGKMTLQRVFMLSPSTLKFRNSNLGKIEFLQCDFRKANLDFKNTQLTDFFISDSDFPTKVFISGNRNYLQEQLAFGQLALSYQKQGNSAKSYEYYSRALEAYYKGLKLTWRTSVEKFPMWLNSVSSRFGRQWLRAVIFTFSVGIIFFCLLLISTEQFTLGLSWPDITLLPAFLKFLNPLRFFELDFLFNNTPIAGRISLTPLSYMWDFIGRIFLSYGFYQTVQAFRKSGKK